MLYHQSVLESALFHPEAERSWFLKATADVLSTIGTKDSFPCPFSKIAVKNNNLLFSFVEDGTPTSLKKCAGDLRDYLDRSRNWDGNLKTAEPLLMAFNPHHFFGECVEDYHRMGWDVLQFWHDHDPKPWPENIARDPHSPFWSMCYDGTQIFINMSNPAHQLRRSRNLGSAMTFVINPRERFDRIAGNNPKGKKVRAFVRKRVENYDLIGHSPALGSFQAGDLEWVQYGLKENNEIPKGKCPFHHHELTAEEFGRSSVGEHSLYERVSFRERKSA
jgi:N-omega-hydroxy-L-arginine synthase